MADDRTDRQKAEDKVTDLNAQAAAAEVAVQQEVGKEQLRTGMDPSHELIREQKDLPTPDPEKLPPEDGGTQTNPSEVETDPALFDKKLPEDKGAQKAAAEEVKGEASPSKPATLGDAGKK